MNCPLETRENAQLLLDYCADTLEPECAAALERHIAICGACREFAGSQHAVWQALGAWEAAPVSRDFDSRLYRRIEDQVGWWSLFLRPFHPTFSRAMLRRSLPAAAMAGLLLMAGVILERSAVSPAPPSADMAQVDAVQPEQVERALDAMEMLNEFSHHVRTDSPDSKL
jgi:anti-sigma factor RsiW